MANTSQEGHIASSFSVIEILISIYKFLENHKVADKFCSHTVLSKGHAAYALYAIMSEIGMLSCEELLKIGQPDSYLIGHVPANPQKDFYVGTGSLGHGLPVALGRGYFNVLTGNVIPQFVIVGDGEFNEGSCWETLMLMQKFPYCNLRIFIDNNRSSTRAIPMDRVFDAMRRGWTTVDVNGHDINSMLNILHTHNTTENLIIICDTNKGYPVSAMNSPIWHHRMPKTHEIDIFMDEIKKYFGV